MLQKKITRIKFRLLLLVMLLLATKSNFAQSSELAAYKNPYRYDKDYPSVEFHQGRRAALRNLMPAGSMAIIFSNPVQNRSGDVDYDFHQNPNLYYLSGYTAPNALLLIFKDAQTIDNRLCHEVLFIEERDAANEMWNGRMLGTLEAHALLGIEVVYDLEALNKFQLPLDSISQVYSEKFSDVAENNAELRQMKKQVLAQLSEKVAGKLNSNELKNWLTQLREIKQKEEISLMKKAIDISCAAHLELMKSLQPGMHEYQAQSLLEFEFKNSGAEAPGYPSIVGGGQNTCMLHYATNRQQLSAGQLLLIDAGAEYHGYSADITRTLPVNGKFSDEQKIIYNLVLQAQEAGIKACKAGNRYLASHVAAVKIIQAGLLQLGIIKNESDYRKYFMHGTSHYLGLDVHDVGRSGNLKPGNVITVEPGIYIPEGSDCDKKWWNIGIRIEDNILITDTEPENMSRALPKTVAEIEAIMQEKGFFESKYPLK